MCKWIKEASKKVISLCFNDFRIVYCGLIKTALYLRDLELLCDPLGGAEGGPRGRAEPLVRRPVACSVVLDEYVDR